MTKAGYQSAGPGVFEPLLQVFAEGYVIFLANP